MKNVRRVRSVIVSVEVSTKETVTVIVAVGAKIVSKINRLMKPSPKRAWRSSSFTATCALLEEDWMTAGDGCSFR